MQQLDAAGGSWSDWMTEDRARVCNHLGLWYNVLSERQMALIHSDYARHIWKTEDRAAPGRFDAHRECVRGDRDLDLLRVGAARQLCVGFNAQKHGTPFSGWHR